MTPVKCYPPRPKEIYITTVPPVHVAVTGIEKVVEHPSTSWSATAG